MPITKNGIDVSAWQGNIDWASVRQDKVDFAMIRAAAGTTVDRLFLQNMKGAGLPLGVYLYSYARTPAEATAEARVLLTLIKPFKITYPVAYDIEDKMQHALSVSERTALVQAFCSVIKEAGYRPAVYTSASWFGSMLALSALGDIDKWVAQWDASQSILGEDTAIWQHSATGRVKGIKGDVDLNIAYRDYTKALPAPVAVAATPKPVTLPPVTGTPAASDSRGYKAGQKLNLVGVPMYASATAKAPSGTFTGVYWVYDSRTLSRRIRLTNGPTLAGKKPESQYVTGFANLDELQKSK